MSMQFEDLLGRITNFLENEAKTQTVIGDAFTLGEFSCIPVISTGMGFGTGGGEGDDRKRAHGEGGAAGGGIGIEPIGFLVARGEDITFIATKPNTGLAKAFEKVPDIMAKYFEMKKEMAEPLPV